ncbi:thyroid adenoma-associated protein-like protein [Senna tora]|uniref:Thyroid adenoma-associated protein-like protein n=1 Tax=Senna tora TaxID=362788 RepID=A0A834W3H2_9FABA|nr:thyroid adenoma-associated protein-like protein [Senna tora]
MSAKWRALQHRHRYTYSAVVFPLSYVESLNQLVSHESCSNFHAKLVELISLNSTYAQVNHVKEVASAFGDLLLRGDEASVCEAAGIYLQLLFFENSVPLHRTLVSALAKSRTFHSQIRECFRKLCDELGGGQGKGKRFCVSRAALSVLGMPKLGYLVEVVEDCAVLVAWDVVFSLDSVVSETSACARPSPIVMEQCQEALSCLYYLLQRFPSKFKECSGSESGLIQGELNVMERIVSVILSILKSIAFSRDCFVAAGVALCAGLQVCISSQELGLVIFQGIFNSSMSNSDINCDSEFRNAIGKIPYKGNVYSEILNLSVLSRLCLIRGILTAVSREVLNTHYTCTSNALNGYEAHNDAGRPIKTILYDGILPELCNYCENPIDSHFNFHALTVMQICLQQIKTSLLSNLTNPSGNYDPIPDEMGMRILRIIWNNLEDPLSQTVKQVHLIFDLFLDIQSSLRWSDGGEKIKTFLQKIGSDLLCLGSRCKGRYVPLALLTKRLGAKTMLNMSPDLLYETTQAYIDDDVCCAATSFLKCFLEYLRDEFWASDGIEGGYAMYRGHCLPPILYGLASGMSKLRSNLNTYALPVLLEVDVDSIFPMLSFISVGPNDDENRVLCPELVCADIVLNVEQKIAILVSLLKVSRSLALIEGDIDWCENLVADRKEPGLGTESHALVCIKGINVEILVQWLVKALTHVDESLRVDAAECLFLNPKTSSLPSLLELTLMREAVPLNMRCCSTAFQMKWSSLFRKFFSRVRTALERQLKQGSWRPLECSKNNEVYTSNGNKEMVIRRANDLFHFMRWLSGFLFFSCYPSAPYKRKIMAMELILIMINVWSIMPSLREEFDYSSSENHLYPYNKGMTSSSSTLLLVGSIIDSWDRLRESSFRILLHFPTPLPGISSDNMLIKVIAWAKKLVCSPRVRESDAGALTMRLIFRKYVLELGCLVDASSNVVHFISKSDLLNDVNQSSKFRNPVIHYMKSMIDWLDIAVRDGERDLSMACKNSFVHGILLALRYAFEELDWNSEAILSSISEMRDLLERLLELVMRITSLALWVVSADAWHLPEDMDEMIDDDNLLMDIPNQEHEHMPASEHESNNSKLSKDARSSEQIVMVGCWLAMKEVSLLLGTIIRKIPLPSSTCSDSSELGCSSVDTPSFSSNAVLDLGQLETIGNHFLEVLLKMKHNGAIDKTRAGFTALCNRLLCSNDPRLTEYWMEQLMNRTIAKGQTVDDLLRRSAGIPAAFTALFLSEPEGTPKKLLPQALRWLINVASGSMLKNIEIESKDGGETSKFVLKGSGQENGSSQETEGNESQKSSKIRDEGVIPTVHAFNVLRAAFNDTNLATDTSGFSAEALILAIRSFSSPYWEIRNSACLAFTSLVRRMIGFLNVHKRESARRAITGLEFFHRPSSLNLQYPKTFSLCQLYQYRNKLPKYPSLHSFLSNELEVATELLQPVSSTNSEFNLGNNLHPSLCPILILLSRLKPSSITGETGDELDPFLLMPFIRRCSIQSNLRVRVLASRALVSLVSNEKLSSVLLKIASGLPCMENLVTSAPSLNLSCTIQGSGSTLNLIHGILLQLSSLLDINCKSLADNSKKDQIVGELVKILIPRSWIARPTYCPCPILNAAFLRVLDQMLNIARSCQNSQNFYPTRNLLLELSAACLDSESSYGLSYYDPTVAELREQAALSYFGCLFQAPRDEEEVIHVPMRHSLSNSNLSPKHERETAFPGFMDRLIRCLSDSIYEVRLATLKWLLKFLKAADSGGKVHDLSSDDIGVIQLWAKTNLHATLMKILVLEKNRRCTYYILRILLVWNLLQFDRHGHGECTGTNYVGEMDFDSVFQFWNELISMYQQTRHAKTRETLVCCLGVCAKKLAILFTSSILSDEGTEKLAECGEINREEKLGRLYDCIVFYSNMIKQRSSSSEPVSMRKAAAESLIASGLLDQAGCIGFLVINKHSSSDTSIFEIKEAANLYAHQILDVWFTCIKLMEDEDDSIRLQLSSDVQKCFTLERSQSSPSPELVPSQVDRVIRFCFDHLSSIFGHWLEYFNYLAQWVLHAASYVASSQGDLVRRVFDKEIDNHYEEKLLISQICCSHLEKLPSTKSWAIHSTDKDEFRNYLHGWRMKFFHQLMSFAEDHIVKQESFDWIGGVGNHKDAFLPLYANLLGFYALSNCILSMSSNTETVPLLSHVIELGRSIKPFLTNPLIVNLYLLVLKSHEKMTGNVANPFILESRDDSSWDSFSPYFLLA